MAENNQKNKILIIHLSDVHVRNSSRVPVNKIEELARLVSNFGAFNKVFLAFTGDLTHSGMESEFAIFEKLVGTFLEQFKRRGFKLEWLIIPGNHDMTLEDDGERNHSTIKKSLEYRSWDDLYDDDICKLNDFLNLSKRFNLFKDHKSYDVKSYDFENSDIRLEFTLLNTAPFSTRTTDDKELHYLPADALQAIKKEDSKCLKIVLMHHPCNWFETECQLELERILEKHCDLLLTGHEHSGFTEQRGIVGQKELLEIRSGEFHPDEFNETEVNLCMIDLDERFLEEHRYTWDRKTAMFVKLQEGISKKLDIKTPGIAKPRAQYIDELNIRIPYLELSLQEIFVFPEFQAEISSSDLVRKIENINEEDDFFELLEHQKIIYITGSAQSGKTSLLLHLYESCIKFGFSPLLLWNESKLKMFKHYYKTLAREQYGDNTAAYEEYVQTDINRKILFIDDFDMLNIKKDAARFFRDALSTVGHIVVSSNNLTDEAVMDKIKSELGEKDYMLSLRIKGFYKRSRDELIKKVCKLKCIDEDLCNEIILIMDKGSSRHIGLHDPSPDFVLRSTKFYLANGIHDRADEASYGKIYDSSIGEQIEKSIHNADKEVFHVREECTVFLELLAASIHVNRSEYISKEESVRIIRDYCDIHNLKVKPEQFFKIVTEAGILEYDDDGLRLHFTSVPNLAFFVARWLSDLMAQNDNKASSIIDELIKEICFRVNENILLFLAYLRHDLKFPLEFCEEAEQAIGDQPELSFDSGKIHYLIDEDNPPAMSMATPEDKKHYDQSLTATEEEFLSHQFNYLGPYEYKKEDCELLVNKIDRAIKCMSIVGKSLVSLNERLDKTSKELIADELFRLPNKVLTALLKDTVDNFDDIAETVYRELLEDENRKSYDLSDVKKIMRALCLTLCIGIYDQVAFDCSTKGTISYFDEYEKTNTNNRVQHLCMLCYAQDSPQFIKTMIDAMEVAKKSRNILEQTCIRILANHYLNTHPNVSVSDRNRLNVKVFENSRKQHLQQLKNK